MRRAIDTLFVATGKLLARWVELGERRLAESRVDALCDRYARGEPIPRAEVDATCKPLGMTFDQWREQARKRHAERELQRN